MVESQKHIPVAVYAPETSNTEWVYSVSSSRYCPKHHVIFVSDVILCSRDPCNTPVNCVNQIYFSVAVLAVASQIQKPIASPHIVTPSPHLTCNSTIWQYHQDKHHGRSICPHGWVLITPMNTQSIPSPTIKRTNGTSLNLLWNELPWFLFSPIIAWSQHPSIVS